MIGKDEIIAHCTGFAHAVGITVKIHEGPSSTDGKEIWMDCRPCASRREFQGRCGTVSHEAAHVIFETPTTVKTWAAEIIKQTGAPDWQRFAAHECINVIVDVADETRMEKRMPSTADDMQIGNELAGGFIVARYRTWEGAAGMGIDPDTRKTLPPSQPWWRWSMLLGILYTRLIGKRGLYSHSDGTIYPAILRNWKKGVHHAHHPLHEVIELCAKARTTGKGVGPRRQREWNKLKTLSLKMFDIIRPYLKESDEPKPTKPGEGEPQPKGRGGAGGSDPGKDARDKGQEAEAKKGKAASGEYGAKSGRSNTTFEARGKFDEEAYSEAKQGMQMRAEHLMEAETQQVCRATDEGDELNGNWAELWGDGACFNRMDLKPDTKLSLALLLDISGSMGRVIGKTQAVCKAYAEVLSGCGADVRVWKFGRGCQQVRWQDLHHTIELHGCTRGADAVQVSSEWLGGVRDGRKIVLILTDGSWSDSIQTHSMMIRGGSLGVEYVLVGLQGYSTHSLKRAFIGGIRAIVSESPHALADLLIHEMGMATV